MPRPDPSAARSGRWEVKLYHDGFVVDAASEHEARVEALQAVAESLDLLRAPSLWSLTDDEYRALTKARRSGIEGAFQFPAPSPCRSLEDWIRHGDECWRRLRAKLYRSLPTAWDSRMLMVPRV